MNYIERNMTLYFLLKTCDLNSLFILRQNITGYHHVLNAFRTLRMTFLCQQNKKARYYIINIDIRFLLIF